MRRRSIRPLSCSRSSRRAVAEGVKFRLRYRPPKYRPVLIHLWTEPERVRAEREEALEQLEGAKGRGKERVRSRLGRVVEVAALGPTGGHERRPGRPGRGVPGADRRGHDSGPERLVGDEGRRSGPGPGPGAAGATDVISADQRSAGIVAANGNYTGCVAGPLAARQGLRAASSTALARCSPTRPRPIRS